MVTLAQLRTRILAKVADGEIVNPTAAQVTDQINSSIDFFENKDFWFNQAEATLTCTVDTRALTTGMPTDFGQFRKDNALVLLDNDVRYTLIPLKSIEFDAIDVEGPGLPRFYIYRDQQIQLYNYPDQAYSVYLYYIKTYPDLSADGSTNDFLTYAARLIEYKTLADIFRDYRSDPDKADSYDGGTAAKGMGGKIAGELQAVINQTYNRTASGVLLTENIIDDDAEIESRYYR